MIGYTVTMDKRRLDQMKDQGYTMSAWVGFVGEVIDFLIYDDRTVLVVCNKEEVKYINAQNAVIFATGNENQINLTF